MHITIATMSFAKRQFLPFVAASSVLLALQNGFIILVVLLWFYDARSTYAKCLWYTNYDADCRRSAQKIYLHSCSFLMNFMSLPIAFRLVNEQKRRTHKAIEHKNHVFAHKKILIPSHLSECGEHMSRRASCWVLSGPTLNGPHRCDQRGQMRVTNEQKAKERSFCSAGST